MSEQTTGPVRITREEFQLITELLRTRTGIRLVPGKEALVMGRLDRRIRHFGLTSYSEYIRRLRMPAHREELRNAIDLLTTNETSFFREEQHFEFLRDVILPARQANRKFRLWSAASSSGEEAYTSAMVIAEAMCDEAWEVFGTDISSRVIRRARRGVYSLDAANRIPRPLLMKYCLKGRDEYDGMMAISRELRSRVSFTRANLMGDLRELGTFDVIMLRNVMIYFEAETRARLVGSLQDMLRPGGYLIVGHSETLSGIPSRLRVATPSIYQLPEDSHV